MSTTKYPKYEAFVVTAREGSKDQWTKIGAAWPHKDEKGLDIKLSAVPTDGRLVLRTYQPKEA